MPPKRLSWLLGFLIALLLLPRLYQTAVSRVLSNHTAVALNRAIAHPHLSHPQRQQLLQQAAINPVWQHTAVAEQAHRQQAATYLQTSTDYQLFELGRQLLYNPDFMHELTGWVSYRATWQTAVAPNDPHIVQYSRQGDGHGSLSQPLSLSHGRCYLFMLTGAVQRHDTTPTLWFYLETYDAHNQPTGQALARTVGSQPWQTQFAPFCLTDASHPTDKMTVAPVNLYGDATVQLGSARLYELLPKATP